MIKLLALLRESLVTLKPTDNKKEKIGKGYNSKYTNSPHKFILIYNKQNERVGEIDYQQIDKDTIDLISIYMDVKNKGYGEDAVKDLYKLLNIKTIVLMSAPKSKRFWTKKLGFKPIPGTVDYYIKSM